MPATTFLPSASTFISTLLAAPPLAGQATPGGSAPGAAPGARPASGGDPTFIYLTLVLLVGMVLFTLFAQRKERRKRESLLSALKKHDRVQTIGGVIGTVVEIKPELVVLKVDEQSNIRMTFARSAVQQILRSSADEEAAA